MLASSNIDEPLPTLLERLNEGGYLIFESVLGNAMIDRVHGALAPYLQGQFPGRNDFEGYDSERVYGLLAKNPVFADLVSHPVVLNLCQNVLGDNFLLSACLAINLHPGETAQALHTDDGFYRVPRPRPAYGLSTFWAVDAYTEDNGATEIIPGSHLWGDERPSGALDGPQVTENTAPIAEPEGLETVVMPAGSLLVCLGTVWHRGGANRSNAPRLAITPQYCPAWCRQIENMWLSVPPETVAQYPDPVQSMLGYSLHPPFMGYVDGRHPRKLLKS